MAKLTLGYKASAEQFAPRDLLNFGVAAEQNGFDSVVVSDHYQPWNHTDGHAPHSFTWLAALGERTKTVKLGTSVVTPTFRYHPAIIAQTMGTLDQLSPGRVFLGVGTGESLNEVAVLDIKWPGFKERFGRLKESIDLMRQLWTEDHVSFQGEYYRTRDATVYDKPTGTMPLYIAGAGASAARLAGRVAEGFICTSGKAWELYTETLLPAVKEGAEKAGRDYDSIEKMIEMKVSYDTDGEKALQDTRLWAALALPPEAKTGVEDPREMQRMADELPIEKVASRWIVSSDPDEQVEKMKPYIDLGFTHLVFHAPGLDQVRFIELYGRDVLPKLRALAG
ncbi:MAG: glucose-6-phosphate dehydrogenase (coenzyme-F420) [Chloroflexota bacterium]